MVSTWLTLALLAAVGTSVYTWLQKRLLDDSESAYTLGYIISFYGLLIASPLAVYVLIQTPPSVDSIVYLIVAVLGLVEILALTIHLKALEVSDLSLVTPIRRVTPTAVAVSEPFVLGATFGVGLIAAAVSTTMGGYFVLLTDRDLTTPIKRLTELGPSLALVAALLYALLSLGSRFSASRLSPYVYGMLTFAVMFVGYGVILWSNDDLPTPREHVSRSYLSVGLVGAFRSILVWMAFALASATAVNIVQQLVVLLNILIGGAFLNEGHMKQRIFGGALIVIGVVMVA